MDDSLNQGIQTPDEQTAELARKNPAFAAALAQQAELVALENARVHRQGIALAQFFGQIRDMEDMHAQDTFGPQKLTL